MTLHPLAAAGKIAEDRKGSHPPVLGANSPVGFVLVGWFSALRAAVHKS
jgi:hypothetical protein